MSRAIDADALEKDGWMMHRIVQVDKNTMQYQTKKPADFPIIEPKRNKGKWIQNNNGTYSCSLCQSWIPEEQHYYAQFCLYCGADMREKGDK